MALDSLLYASPCAGGCASMPTPLRSASMRGFVLAVCVVAVLTCSEPRLEPQTVPRVSGSAPAQADASDATTQAASASPLSSSAEASRASPQPTQPLEVSIHGEPEDHRPRARWIVSAVMEELGTTKELLKVWQPDYCRT